MYYSLRSTVDQLVRCNKINVIQIGIPYFNQLEIYAYNILFTQDEAKQVTNKSIMACIVVFAGSIMPTG